MAANNGGRKRNNRTTGGAASAASSHDDRELQRIIDGDSSRPSDGANENDGETSGGSERERGSGESESGGSGNASGGSERERGSGESESGGTGTGTDSRRTRNRSGGVVGGSENRSSSEETRKVADSVSRTVKSPKAAKIDAAAELPSNNKEIIGDVFQFVFWGVGQATGIPEWELEEDDAQTIGENGDKWLKSLGPKRAKNIVNGLKKVGPSIAFFGSLGMALIPRVRLTISHATNGVIKPIQERKTSGNSSNHSPSGDSTTVGSSSADGAAGVHARPFTAQDIGEVTQGHAFENAGG